MQGELPTDWKLEEEPDGSLSIIPRARSTRTSGLWLVAAGLGCCGLAGLLFMTLSRGRGGWRSLRLTLLLPLGLWLMGQGLWLAFGREEWCVSGDLLEVRRSLLGLRWTRRFRGATLRLVGSTNAEASRAQRALLRASRTGARLPHAAGAWMGLFVVDQRGRRCLASTSRDSTGPAQLRALGELLSEATGWPLLSPRAGKKR